VALAGTGFSRREPNTADSVTVEADGGFTGQKPYLLTQVHCGAKTYQVSRENAVARGQPAAITGVSCAATVLRVIEICQLNPLGATSEGSTCPSFSTESAG